jgi:phosphonate transport system ATP-binding protein
MGSICSSDLVTISLIKLTCGLLTMSAMNSPPDRHATSAAHGSRMPQAVLHVEDVEVTYDTGVRALKRTTLSIREGEFVVLLGPSGAGKSTLLRVLNGLVTPSAGQVLLPSTGMTLASTKALQGHRRRTGMVFQQHHLIGRQTVLSNVLMGRLGWHGALATLAPWRTEDKHLALAAIERVGLIDKALVRADTLSGGQQQRVGIARALVQQPRLLLADEPVASLDPATAMTVLTLLYSICKTDGLAAVVSLHQVDLARRFADRVVGLSQGAVQFDCAAEGLDESGRIDALYASTSATHEPARPTTPVISTRPILTSERSIA